jgi:hypothetical protein
MVLMMDTELSEDTLLTRKALAKALTEKGYPVKPSTLNTKATRGGGPPFQRFGPRAIYTWGNGLRWAQSRLGPLIANTSEATRSAPAQGSEKRGTKVRRQRVARERGRTARPAQLRQQTRSKRTF